MPGEGGGAGGILAGAITALPSLLAPKPEPRIVPLKSPGETRAEQVAAAGALLAAGFQKRDASGNVVASTLSEWTAAYDAGKLLGTQWLRPSEGYRVQLPYGGYRELPPPGTQEPVQRDTSRPAPSRVLVPPPIRGLPPPAPVEPPVSIYGVPILRATQPGAPPGTGSGVGAPPPPQIPGQLQFILAVLDALRRFGVRLPWDPRPARPRASISISLPDFQFAFPATPSGVGGTMANVWTGILQGAGALLGGVLNQMGTQPYGGAGVYTGAPVLPGGAPLALPPIVGLGTPFPATTGGDLTSPWAVGMRGATAKIHLQPNPTTGKLTFFGPLGSPVLFSRDLSSAKKVRRLARRARRAVGGR